MDELIKALDGHWPVWAILIVVLLMFILKLLDMILKFAAGVREGRNNNSGGVSHADIWKQLGAGEKAFLEMKERMDSLFEITQQNSHSLMQHMQQDTNAQNAILDSINQIGKRLEEREKR